MSDPVPDPQIDRPNVFFRLLLIAGAVFIVTILAMVASLLGDPQAPPTKWLDRHGTTILMGEVLAIVVTSFLALAIDRRRTLRKQRDDKPAEHDS